MISHVHYDEEGNRARVAELRRRGVEVWSADRVFINGDVDLDAICAGAVLMNAVISGSGTLIGSRSHVGVSGAAFLHNACLGEEVETGAGTYTNCVLLNGVKVRGCAEIRGGTILEEGVELGHNVGLKNSILTCWTVAGSCINFCDVFVTGGTSREDHSEIGSGAVHFNFSPQRDKFASAFGDIRGVLLRSGRVFIGGKSGIVAPSEIAFGDVIPAGTTVRQGSGPEDYDRKLKAALRFIRHLSMLEAWYRFVRLPHCERPGKGVIEGAIRQLECNRRWRIAELHRFVAQRGKPESVLSDDPITEKDFSRMVGSVFLDEYSRLRTQYPHTSAIRGLASEVADHVATQMARSML